MKAFSQIIRPPKPAPLIGAAASISRSKAAHQINNDANQQDQADAAATKSRAANIKAAAAKQEEQNDDQ